MSDRHMVIVRKIKPKKPGGTERWEAHWHGHESGPRIVSDNRDRAENLLRQAHPWKGGAPLTQSVLAAKLSPVAALLKSRVRAKHLAIVRLWSLRLGWAAVAALILLFTFHGGRHG